MPVRRSFVVLALAGTCFPAAGRAGVARGSPRADAAPDTAGIVASDSAAAPDRRLAFGAGVGSLSYADGYTERLLMGGARLRLVRGLTLAVHPGFASASGAASTQTSGTVGSRRRGSGTSRSTAGFTDLPIELAAEHEFGVAWSPTLNASYDVLAPTGNARRGLGAGVVGGSLDVGVGVTPVERVTVDAGVGRYRSGTAWALQGGPAATWGDATLSVEVARPLTLAVGAGTNLGTGEQADRADAASGRTVDGAATLRLRGLPPLTFDARHGYTGTAPRWSVGLEVGSVGLPLTTLGRLGQRSGRTR